MRRNTSGVIGMRELLDPRVRSAEAYELDHIVRVLEPLVTSARLARIRGIVARRIGSIAVALDGPYDPHNGAAVVRSCEAFGVQQLHVIERACTPFVVAKSVSRSAQKWLDIVCHSHSATALEWAKNAAMPLVAADPDGSLVPDDLATMPRLAIVLGSEHEGIRAEIARACVARVRVPMRGFVESLNLSVTAAILLHAATRDRAGDLHDEARLRLYARGLILSVPRAIDLLAHG